MKWKSVWIALVSISAIGITGWFVYWVSDFSPGSGTLGSTANTCLNCSESDVSYRMADTIF